MDGSFVLREKINKQPKQEEIKNNRFLYCDISKKKTN